jgi:hypothetical protein
MKLPPDGRPSEVKRESTSLKINPELWKEAKIQAIRDDMELSELVEKAILEYLAKIEHESRNKRK